LNLLIRQTHRWVSIAFVAIVIAIFVTLGMGKQPPQWVYYVPLAPLAFLALTGLYMFALPYLAKGRSQRTVNG
jgi:ABC-type polysaccharide/polyol phosphate export permease